MKAMSLREIADACSGHYYGEESKLNIEVSGISIDSRQIEEGFLFVPIKGTHVDGHAFIPQVMEKGALCTLSEVVLENVSHPYILVGSSEQALRDLAEHYRNALDIKVVGITGSVGKTSTKEMIASVLSQKYNVLKTEGNFNNEIGLPLTIFNIREEHEVAVLEMGISHFDSDCVYLNGNKTDKRIECVFIAQDTEILDMSIKDNLTLGNTNITDEMLVEHLEAVGLKDWYDCQEKGLDTILGERGVFVSTGQRQRLNLIRGLLINDKEVYLLDEPTSNVDDETEDIMIDLIKRSLKDKTVIIVTHKPKIKNICNHSYKFENGIVSKEY